MWITQFYKTTMWEWFVLIPPMFGDDWGVIYLGRSENHHTSCFFLDKNWYHTGDPDHGDKNQQLSGNLIEPIGVHGINMYKPVEYNLMLYSGNDGTMG